jgi:hypothetical protein
MIRVSNSIGADIKVFTSVSRTIPGGMGYTGTYIDTVSHNLGAVPDRVDIIMTGDTAESVGWYSYSGPYAQYGDAPDTGYNVSVGSLGNRGCVVFSKSPTQFKVMFHRLWGGTKVYYKAYIFGGILRSS